MNEHGNIINEYTSMSPTQPNQQIQVKASDEKIAGAYANVMNILMTKEEFVIDFLSAFPPTGVLTSRVIVSPAHFKRIARVIQENLKRYEDEHGKIEESAAPNQQTSIGF